MTAVYIILGVAIVAGLCYGAARLIKWYRA
jgi:hypothetical protein